MKGPVSLAALLPPLPCLVTRLDGYDELPDDLHGQTCMREAEIDLAHLDSARPGAEP